MHEDRAGPLRVQLLGRFNVLRVINHMTTTRTTDTNTVSQYTWGYADEPSPEDHTAGRACPATGRIRGKHRRSSRAARRRDGPPRHRRSGGQRRRSPAARRPTIVAPVASEEEESDKRPPWLEPYGGDAEWRSWMWGGIVALHGRYPTALAELKDGWWKSEAHVETLCALVVWRQWIDDAGRDPREELAFQVSSRTTVLLSATKGAASPRMEARRPTRRVVPLIPEAAQALKSSTQGAHESVVEGARGPRAARTSGVVAAGWPQLRTPEASASPPCRPRGQWPVRAGRGL